MYQKYIIKVPSFPDVPDPSLLELISMNDTGPNFQTLILNCGRGSPNAAPVNEHVKSFQALIEQAFPELTPPPLPSNSSGDAKKERNWFIVSIEDLIRILGTDAKNLTIPTGAIKLLHERLRGRKVSRTHDDQTPC